MFDCENVQMREMLPDLLAGSLDALTRGRVEHHLASCAECASELETLRLVRSAYRTAPAIDVNRVVAALPKPIAVLSPRVQKPAPKRWVDWRIAAALTTITVGGLSLAVAQRFGSRVDTSADTIVAVQPAPAMQTPVATPPAQTRTPRIDTGPGKTPSATASAGVKPVATKAQLSFGGGMSDLDDASIKKLLGALDEIDRAPVAPSVEPDPTPVLPVIKGSDQ